MSPSHPFFPWHSLAMTGVVRGWVDRTSVFFSLSFSSFGIEEVDEILCTITIFFSPPPSCVEGKERHKGWASPPLFSSPWILLP